MNYYLIITYNEKEKEFFCYDLANLTDSPKDIDRYREIIGEYYAHIILLNEQENITITEESIENLEKNADLKSLFDLIISKIEGKYLEEVSSSNFEMVVIAIHFKKGDDHLKKNEIQKKLNEKLSKYKEGIVDDSQRRSILDKMKIVYYSRIDKDNSFARKFYSYKKLFDDKDGGEFPKFLKLLEARAEGKEIEFFDLKKKIDDLYHEVSLKALACKGIMKCIKREKYGTARNYQLQSFENKDFVEILKELKKDKEKIDDKINGKLNELNPEYYEGLSYYYQLSQFFKWYKEFLIILVKKKKEVEKGE